jgi:hypothetical protein
MTRSLLVANAHAADLLTFLMAFSLAGIAGESNGVMQTVYASGGLVGVVISKTAGTVLAAAIVTRLSPGRAYSRWKRFHQWALLPAAGAGLLGASVNLVAIGVIR